MTEAQVLKKFYEKYDAGEHEPPAVFWRSPAYQKMRWDIFGVFDIVAVEPDRTSFIQLTTLSHLSHRRAKIQNFFDKIGFKIPNSYILAYDEKRDDFKIERQDKTAEIIDL